MSRGPAVDDNERRSNPPQRLIDRIDMICDRFEAVWKSGGQPDIEGYLDLGSLVGTDRSALFKELLFLDLEYRRASRETPRAHEYRRRFPVFTELIEQVFSESQLTAPRTVEGSDGQTEDQPLPTGRREADEEVPARFGRYAVRGVLGRGGFSTVYLGFDEDLARCVAIKVPRAEVFSSQESEDRFLAEARTVARLRHPSIVNIYDVGRTDDGSCFVVLEYIEGESLSTVCQKQAKLPPERVEEVMTAVAEAIHYAHKQGFVHRDLKPGNLFMDGEGRPHVADFGLAIHEASQRWQAGEVSGTPAYMSPEQVLGETHRMDGRSDIWSLGVILYELLTGRRPFGGQNRDELFDEILHREPKPPRQYDDAIPKELERICLKCLAKRMSDRYTTALDLARDLRAVTPGDLTVAFIRGQSEKRHDIGVHYVGDSPVPGYRLLALLGKGHHGDMWRAAAPSGAEVALRIVQISVGDGARMLDVLRRIEYLGHPNLVPIASVWLVIEEGRIVDDPRDIPGVAEWRPPSRDSGSGLGAIVTPGAAVANQPAELVVAMGLARDNLANVLNEHRGQGLRGIPGEELLGYMDSASKALDYLNQPIHNLGRGLAPIVHGEIRPSHLLIAGGEVQVCDVSVAHTVGLRRQLATAMSTHLYSYAYAAPELMAGKPTLTSDQYSLAMTFVKLRTGALPFQEKNPLKLALLYHRGELKLDLSRLGMYEREVVRKATSLDPSKRWRSCLEMSQELRRAREAEHGRRPPPG